MQSIEEEAEEADEAGAVSFVQLGQPRVLLSALAHSTSSTEMAGPEQDKRTQVLALLRTESSRLKSTLLASLAVQVAADPFAKIKKLIQELIERLMQEAADEANHKGWCDKETSAAKQARTYNAEEIAILEAEIKELEDQLAKATKLRADEKAENA